MKNLTKILLLGTSLSFGAGCSTQRPLVNEIVYNTEFSEKTNDKSKYQLEDITFFDERYFILNERPAETNTLPFKLSPFNTTHQQFTYGATIPKIVPEQKYILKKAKVNDNFLGGVELTDVKAYAQKTKQNKDNDKYKTITTEKGFSYDIPFTKINNEEYYYFLLNLNNTKTLGMIPCKKATIDIKNGNISLLAPGEVYALTIESKITYKNESFKENKTNPQKTNSTPTYYTIKQGDYLYKIAREKNIPVKVLMELNPQIEDFEKIKIGQQIRLK